MPICSLRLGVKIMKPFIMYKLESFDGYNSNGAGVGGKVTVKVRFIANKFDQLSPASTDRIFDGSFTGILVGVFISSDNTYGHMFFKDGAEIIYDPENLPLLGE